MSDFNQYSKYLKALFAPTDTVCFTYLKDGAKTVQIFVAMENVTAQVFENQKQFNDAGYNIYVAMNPFKSELQGKDVGRTKENVAKVKRLYADADKNGDEVLEKIRTSTVTPPPDVILNSSPGKYQFIWNVEGLTQEAAEPLLEAIAHHFGTDPKVAEVARVLRVPGFKNRKYAEGPEVTVVDNFIDDEVFKSSQFVLQVRSAEATKQELPRDENNLVPVGYIHHFMLSVAGKLRNAGLTVEEILPILRRRTHEECQTPPGGFNDSKIVAMAKSMANYPQGKNTDVFLGPPEQTPQPVDWRGMFRSRGELQAGEVEMLVNNFVSVGNIFLAGPSFVGKTFLALSICRALTTGRPLFGREEYSVPKKVPVLYLAPEVSGQAFRKRLDSFEIPNDPALFLCRTISEGHTLPLGDAAVMEAVRTMKPVVVLDTFVRFSESGDENSASENKAIVDAMITLRQAGAVAVIALHHSIKDLDKEGMRLETVLRGTGDIAACADAVWGMKRDNPLYQGGVGPTEIDMECVKARDYATPQPIRVALTRKIKTGETNAKPFGLASSIASCIDETGDFVVVQGSGSMVDNLAARLHTLLSADPSYTLKELEAQTKATPWVIRAALKKAGWEKPKASKTWMLIGSPEHSAKLTEKLKSVKVHIETESGSNNSVSLETAAV